MKNLNSSRLAYTVSHHESLSSIFTMATVEAARLVEAPVKTAWLVEAARLLESPLWPGAWLEEEEEADIARVAMRPGESCSMSTTDSESAARKPVLSPSCSFRISDDTS